MPSPEFLKFYTQDYRYRPEFLEELGITPYILDRTGKSEVG
jgi:hypothetical protein